MKAGISYAKNQVVVEGKWNRFLPCFQGWHFSCELIISIGFDYHELDVFSHSRQQLGFVHDDKPEPTAD